MNRTFIHRRREASKKISNYAIGYVWIPGSFEKATQDDPRVGQKMVYYMDGVYGAAKVNSTVEDLYKWMNAIKKNKILSKEEFEEVMAISKTSLDKEVSYGFGFDVRKRKESISYGHTGSWDGYINLIHYNSAKDRTIIIVNNFNNGTCPYNTIEEILDNKPSSNEYVKKVELKEEEIRQFVGEYIDPKDSTQIHIISYLEGHLVYNTDKLKWDMRFFPSSANTFQAIRQGGTDGVMKFILQSDGTMGLEMSQYGRAIGTGIRKN